MTSSSVLSYRSLLAGVLVLITACGPLRSTPSLGVATSQPTQAPNVTLTLASGPPTTPIPTSVSLAVPTATAPMPQASPTVPTVEAAPLHLTEVAPSPVPDLADTPQPTPLPTPTPTPPPPAFPPTVSLEPVLSGFRAPVYVTHAGQDPSEPARLFVVEKEGRIHLMENGSLLPTAFLDITDRVGSENNEQGLLSVAFPPDFAASGIFYVNYTDRGGDTIIARYRLLADNLGQADPRSEQKILQIEQPATNHNGGQLQFGPDGYLYIGTGDGGRAGDPWGNAQNPDVLLGKMLRIDVAGTDSYTVPADNPLLDQPGTRPEIWAIGLRNPWRFSFDRTTGALYIADVGQNKYEELDFQPATSSGGENYGWDVMEGSHCFEPPNGCASEGLVPPIAEYDHSQGCSVTGGYVYRGTRNPEMDGVYFFGDFCSGNIWGVRQNVSGEWEMALLLDTDMNISSFGEDSAGEIYVVDFRGGEIYHLVASP